MHALAQGRAVAGPPARCRRARAVGSRRGRDEHLPEGPRVDVAELAPLGEGDHHVGVLGLGLLDALDPQQLAAHAQVHDQGVAAVQADQQVLAEPADRLDGPPLEQGAELLGAGVPAHRAAVGHRDRLDLAPDDLLAQVLAERLDLGELRHRSPRLGGHPAVLDAQPSPGGAGRRLLGVLLRLPSPDPAHPPDEDLGHVAAVVVGPRALHHVAGRPVAVAHGQLLEPALVVEVVGLGRRPLDALPQEAQDHLAGGRPVGVEVDRADHRLQGVGQDGHLCPAPRRLLAPARAAGPSPGRARGPSRPAPGR